MKVPMIFEKPTEVEIFEVNNQILFIRRHAAECLDVEFKTVQNYMSEMSDKTSDKTYKLVYFHLTGISKTQQHRRKFSHRIRRL